MSNNLDLYQNILFLELRPWQNRTTPDQKFKQMILELTKEHYENQPLYAVDFIKPLTPFRKYYHAIIENEAIRYLNVIHKFVRDSTTDPEKKYWVHTTLTKKITQKLKEVAAIISEKSYSEITDSHGSNNLAAASIPSDDAYVILFLKHQLIRIYLEIQNTFLAYVHDDIMSEDELLSLYFSHPTPYHSILKNAPNIFPDKPLLNLNPKESKQPFNAVRSDIREVKKGILSYEVIIKNPSRFATFEEKLLEYEYINEKYEFSDKHGQKQQLAAIYHQLINKKYFNPRNFSLKAEIKPIDIRKFLDHRYRTDVDKQFRDYANHPEKLAKYIESQYWLDKLLSC